MPHHFANFPETVASVGEITARCDLALPDGHPIWRALNVLVGQIQDGRLAALIEEGVDTRYGAGVTAELRRRLQREPASTTGMVTSLFSDCGQHRGFRPPGLSAGQNSRQHGIQKT